MDDLDLVGMNIGDAFTLLRAPYHLAPGAVATLNGEEVDAGTVLSPLAARISVGPASAPA